MKHLRTYEELKRSPQKGDWIILSSEFADSGPWWASDEGESKYIYTTSFELISIEPLKIYYTNKENIGIYNEVAIRLIDIEFFGTKEEMKITLQAKKYNI